MKIDAEEYRRRLRTHLVLEQVPYTLWDGLVEYLVERRPTGSFLTAVLSNDLTSACLRADLFNRPRLATVVLFLVNYAPANAWGSEKNVAAWLASTEPVVDVGPDPAPLERSL